MTGEPNDATSFVEAAQSVASVVEAEASAGEVARTLTPRCVAAVVDAGILRAFVPRELGGAELNASALVPIVEELARQDGSTGWCFGMNGIIGGIASAMLPDTGVDEVFAPRRPGETLIAGGFPPVGRCERSGDGWRVSGHFQFGSGCRHSHFMLATCLELKDGAPQMDGALPAMRSFLLPTAEVRIEDNWRVAGLEATASCDYHLDAAHVPDHRSFSSSSFAPFRGKSLYAMPLLSIAGAPHSGFALGVGKAALDEVAQAAVWRHRLGAASPLAQRSTFQVGYARSRTRLRAARGLVLEALANLAAACAEGAPSLAARAETAAATTNAYETATEVATFAFRAAGGSALMRDNRLQRSFRDAHAGAQHIVVSDESWERVAQVWLGIGEPQMI